MSADHRKPVVAFVVLAFLAAALVGVQRADAQAGGFLAAVLGSDAHVQGQAPLIATSGRLVPSTLPEAFNLGSREPATSAAPETQQPRGGGADVSRAHVRGDLAGSTDRHSTRSAASGPAGPAADRSHAAVSKPMPEHAVAKGRNRARDERRSETARSGR